MKTHTTHIDIPTKSGVYLLKRRGRVIYTGASRNVLSRMAGHAGKDFDAVEIRWMPAKAAFREESRLIRAQTPPLNSVRQKLPESAKAHQMTISIYPHQNEYVIARSAELGVSISRYFQMLIDHDREHKLMRTILIENARRADEAFARLN